ncbi:indolepyruvate ferredoxin oxidoreductase subunit alpha [Candidatus Fermentibacterales bacterium]|nr:indolepyruvate ferredoxin oxidoreductase subunit alpha [Candidatus Fermentibacterales bacterium]
MDRAKRIPESGVEFLSGNEAVARGAWEYGVHFASAYPGTPSTEILEAIGESYPEIGSQWAPNEKVALETVAGASFGGARALTAMKHVGLNVAADPLFTLSYIGATGGVVIVSADDPGMHSSQNEQDNRNIARAAKVPMLEPADSNEAKLMVGEALEISERFDAPVMLRLTTRISHSKSLVELGPRRAVEVKGYERNIQKRVPIPAHARKLHSRVEKRMLELEEYGDGSPFNRIEKGDPSLGIVTSGISYQYVKEVLPSASVLKLGMTNPLPWKLIERFIESVEKLVVVEEGDPYLQEQIRARFLIPVEGKERIPIEGELEPGIVRRGLGEGDPAQTPFVRAEVPARPPALCPGCPHRGAFYALSKIKASSTGDIGCYTLGLMPPHEALETVICMGGAVTVLNGLEKAVGREATGKLVAAIGDSTFIHSGITGLIDMVYNGGTGTVMIMDNGITAMTGGQQHPATGFDLRGEPAPRVDFEQLCRACGVKHVRTVDPHDLQEMEKALREELSREEPSVIITRRPCIMIGKPSGRAVARLDPEKCVSCRACMRVGCPAISFVDEKPEISGLLCYPDCNLCVQVCPTGALSKDMEGAR